MTKRKLLFAVFSFALVLCLATICGTMLTGETFSAQAEDVSSYVTVSAHKLYRGFYLESNESDSVSKNAETEPANYVAWYKDGILTLNGYNGGQISGGGDLTIRLQGNNTITSETEGIFVSDCENLIIDADSEATLDINVTSTESDVFGISVGYGPGTYGNVTIKGKSKVNIVCQTTNYKAFGIYSKYVTGIAGEASLDVKCASEKITSGDGDSYGIYSERTPVFNTSGTIKIDTSECATASYCVYAVSFAIDMQNGDCLLKYKKAASRSFASYPTMSNALDGYVMRVSLKDGEDVLKKGTARTVTILNGTDYYEKNSNQYVEGEIVTVKTSVDGLFFAKWESEEVAFAEPTQQETTFKMPDKDVTVSAVYDVFAKQPVFEITGDNKGSLSVQLRKQTSNDYSIVLIDSGEKVNSTLHFKIDALSDNFTYKCSSFFASGVPAGTYKMRVEYNSYYFYSDTFEVKYPFAKVSDANVSGKTGREITPVGFDVTLTDATFKAIEEGTDVSSWFEYITKGLVAKISAVSEGATSATITISGTPTETDAHAIYLNIPKDVLATGNDIGITTKYNSGAVFSIVNPASYSITVKDGKSRVNGVVNSVAQEGTTVTIEANKKDLYVFDKWVVESGDVALVDVNSATTKFVMPESDVEIKATYKKIVYSVQLFVTAPVKDNTADTTYMAVNGTGYTATKVEWYKGEDVVTSMLMSATDKFVAGESYTVVVTVTLNPGYVFADDSTLSKSINKQAATLNSAAGADTITVKTTFDVPTEPIPEHSVTVENGTLKSGATTGNFAEGASVEVTANEPATDMMFDKWTATGITLTDEQLSAQTFTFTMGASDVTLTATYKAIPKYTVTVTDGKLADGNTTGTFTEGAGVKVTANDPATDMMFDKWTATGITLTDEQLSATTITITVGTSNITLTATYTEVVVPGQKYKVTVEDGSADGAEFKMGQVVTITADTAPEGKEFDKWVVVSGDVTIANINKAKTTFIMPSKDVEVKATYKDKIPSGGGTDKPGGEEKPGETPGTDDPSGDVTPTDNDGLSGGAIAGIVVGSVAVVGVGGFSVVWFAIKKKSFAELLAAIKGLFKK